MTAIVVAPVADLVAELLAHEVNTNVHFSEGRPWVDAVTHGADPTGSADSTSAIVAAIAAAAGNTVFLKAGTYRIDGQLISTVSNFKLKGAGKNQTTLLAPTTATAQAMFQTSASTKVANVEIEDLTLDWGVVGSRSPGAISMVAINGGNLQGFAMRRVALRRIPGTGVNLQGNCSGVVLEDLDISSPGNNYGTAIAVGAGCRNIQIIRPKIRYTNQGAQVAGTNSTTGLVTGVQIVRPDIDLGWYTPIQTASNSGGTVTYSATVLTDSAASFSVTNGDFVRLLQSETTGGAGTTYNAVSLTDPSGSFTTAGITTLADGGTTNTSTTVTSAGWLATHQGKYLQGTGIPAMTYVVSVTAGVSAVISKAATATNAGVSLTVGLGIKRGDIVRAGGLFGIVVNVDSATLLRVEEWLSETDRSNQLPPASASAYTAYRPLIGLIGSSTGTTITVTRWWDYVTGASVTPAAGTLYEILPNRPTYPITGNAGTENILVSEGTIRRGYGDQISLYGSRCTTRNNEITDGYDHGIIFQGRWGTSDGDRVRHCGATGIGFNSGQVGASDGLCIGSRVEDCPSNNTSGTGGNTGAFNVFACDRVVFDNCKAYAGLDVNGTSVLPVQAYVINSASDSCRVINCEEEGFATYSVNLHTSSGTPSNTVIHDLKNSAPIALGTATGTDLGVLIGAGPPESVVTAGVGTLYRRTDGGASTSLYVKESGTGNTGWVAK